MVYERCMTATMSIPQAPDLERLARRPCPMASGILRYQLFQVGLGAFVLLVGRLGAAEGGRQLCLAVRSTHIDDTDRFQAGSGWFDPEQPGHLPAHHAAPELLLGGQ